jgi:hypothetical protein
MKSTLLTSMAVAAIVLSTAACKKSPDQPNLAESVVKSNESVGAEVKGTNSIYWQNAQQTHAFVVGNMLTASSSYKANLSTFAGSTFEWYNVSQIYADAAFIQQGDTRYTAYLNSTFGFMPKMWDNSTGGYWTATNLAGNGGISGEKNVDDMGLTGVAYIEAYYNTPAGAMRDSYLNWARSCANWLMTSGQWDTSLGGGFWWDTHKLDKPTQSNGLALQLFLHLYKITGQTYYRDWANSTMNWLETKLYDSSTGLYNWKILANGAVQTRKFTYDNAIMIEAFLLSASVMNNSSYVTKAQNLGIKMNTVLWLPAYKVYNLSNVTGNINPCWSGWGSQAMIKLYERDGNPAWLDYAQQNIDFINLKMKNTSNGGYYQYYNYGPETRSDNYEAVDQAWMQRIQVLLSKYR